MVRLLILGIFLSLGVIGGFGQDLGSSNKLFGPTKKKTVPPKSAKRSSKTSEKRSESVSAKKAPATNSDSTGKGSDPKSKKLSSAATAKEKSPAKPAKKSVDISSSTAGSNAEDSGKTEKKAAPSVDKDRISGEKQASDSTGSAPKTDKGPDRTATNQKETPRVVTPADAERFEELILKGNTHRDEREYAAAEAAYTAAKPLRPNDSRAVYGLGNLYSDQLRWDEAEKHYRQAIAMSPNDAVAHIALSYVLIQPVTAPNLADRYEEAEKLARRALELAPSNALAYDQLGASLELRGFIGPETENAYRKAIQLDPAFAPPHAHLGRLLRRRGQTAEASAAYQTSIDRSRDVGTKILVAEVLQSEQRFSDSETLLRAALKEDERNPTALLLLARALVTGSNNDEAEAVIKKALSIGANGFLANSQLASIYLRQGKPELSENALLQAAKFASELDRRALSRGFEAIGDAYMKAGNNRNAERAFKQAISYDQETDILSGKLSRAQQGRFSPGN